MDVLSLARDRTVSVGVPLSSLTTPTTPAATPTEPKEDVTVAPLTPSQDRSAKMLVKTKSDNKLLVNRITSSEQRSSRSRTPVCTKCSVPLDLPGYVSSCDSCSCSRARFSQSGNGLFITIKDRF